MTPRLVLLLTAGLGLAAPGRAQLTPATYYVAPNGTPTGDGSLERPLDLATALGAQSPARPGDTLLLRGGTYRGPITSVLTGAEGRPIVVRQMPGERATIDGQLAVRGAWTWYRDFEVASSNPDRTRSRPGGVFMYGPYTKLINLIIHENGDGVGCWSPALEAEVYGCIVYRNGWQGPPPDRAHGHGLYVQNVTGAKRLVDNILFNSYGYGLHAYTEQGSLKGIHIEGNIIFNSGLGAGNWRNSNLLVGGFTPAERITLVQNYIYHPLGQAGAVSLGYASGSSNQDAVVRDNYIAGGDPVLALQGWQNLTVNGNTLYGTPELLKVILPPSAMLWSYEIDRNTYIPADNPRALAFDNRRYDLPSWQQTTGFDRNSQWIGNPSRRATGVKVFVRPNQYEPGRIHLVVFNWDQRASIDLDLKDYLAPGAIYEVRNVLDWFGAPVAAGVWTGQPLTLPMAGTQTGPEFNAFVLTSRRSSAPPRVRRPR